VIPHNRPTLGEMEREAAARVLSSGWIAQGPEVEAFEAEICAYLGLAAGHAVALSSGTAALFMALWALAAKGKRVAIPVYSCAALRNAVIMAGAEPVPIDVADDSPNIDLQQAVRAPVDLIIAAHMFGVPGRWHGKATSIPVIEDCAQAFGARVDGQPVGMSGTVGVFSLYATKMLTSGGHGGMLVSSDRSLVDAVRDYRQFDGRRDRLPRFNLQMTDLQAAVGRAQLSQIDTFIRQRKEIHARYCAAGLSLWPAASLPGIEPCYYRAIIRVADPIAAIARLEQNAIRAIIPIADWELLDEPEKFPRAAALAHGTVSVPIYPSLTEHEIAVIIRTATAAPNQPAEMEPS
jgi:perosamine synthetase